MKITINNKEIEIKDEELIKRLEEVIDESNSVYVLMTDGCVEEIDYCKDKWARELSQGSLFPSKEEAEKERDKRAAIWRVKEYIRINFGEFLPDWNSEYELKFSFYYSYKRNELDYNSCYMIKNYSPIGHLRTADHCEQLMKDCKEDLEIIFK